VYLSTQILFLFSVPRLALHNFRINKRFCPRTGFCEQKKFIYLFFIPRAKIERGGCVAQILKMCSRSSLRSVFAKASPGRCRMRCVLPSSENEAGWQSSRQIKIICMVCTYKLLQPLDHHVARLLVMTIESILCLQKVIIRARVIWYILGSYQKNKEARNRSSPL